MDSLNSVSDRLKLGASVLLNYTSYRGNLLHRLPLNARTLRKEIRVFLTKLAVWVESTAYKGRTDILSEILGLKPRSSRTTLHKLW